VDRLAKEAAVEDGPVVYDKIPREVIVKRENENGLQMWQQQWTNSGKGTVTRDFSPSVRNMVRKNIPIFPAFATVVTGHGKISSYLQRFGLTDNPMCPCKEEEEETNYILHGAESLLRS
jgi:hypothetical protein